VVNEGTPETTYFVYDAGGQRLRKVTERQAGAGETPARLRERIYLGAFEVFREYNGAGVAVTSERQTLHVIEADQRLVLIETLTVDESAVVPAPVSRQRYQLGNQLGSVLLELDQDGAIISYEEYHPFGTTAYRAVRAGVEVSDRRYRYTGKERDEETELYYHGARYYAPWLARWTAPDPLGALGGSGSYVYVRNRPITRHDPSGLIDWSIPTWEEAKRDAAELGGEIADVGEAIGDTAERVVDDPVGAYTDYLDATVGESLRYVGTGLGENAGAMIMSAQDLYVDVRTKGVSQTAKEIAVAEIEAVAGELQTVGDAYKGMGQAALEGDAAGVLEHSLKGKEAAESLALRVTGAGGAVSKVAKVTKRAAKPKGKASKALKESSESAPAAVPPAATPPAVAPPAPAPPAAIPPPAPAAAASVKPDVPLHKIFTAKTKGPPEGSKSRGYNRRNPKYQQLMDRALRWWGGPGGPPAKAELAISHVDALFGTRPGQTAVVRIETAAENTARSATEKRQAAARREWSKKQGLDPSDPNNPLYVRPPRK
jgi:RHS repeat-associated protein